MPAAPSIVQSIGTPRTYFLRDGRKMEIRNGVMVDASTGRSFGTSDETAGYLLAHASLTKDERQWLAEWGDIVFRAAAVQQGYPAQMTSGMKVGSVFKEQAA